MDPAGSGSPLKTVIPDASLLLKWVLPPVNEQYVEQAIAIRDALLAGKIRLMVPGLWYYELGNTLSRKYPDYANALLASLTNMEMDCPQIDQDWQATIVQLVSRFQVTFYDAAYHALAINRNGLFVTADEKYIQKAGSAGYIIHLKDWVTL